MDHDSKASRLQAFIGSFIGSVEQLEILCLLSQAPGKAWSPKQVLHIVQSSDSSVKACLENYVQKGLLLLDAGLYRYEPRRPELDEAVWELRQACSDRRVAIIGMIHTRPCEVSALRKGK